MVGEHTGPRLGRSRRSNLASDLLLSRIVRGVWQPGDRLPSERTLSDELSMSRASVREAIRGLEALGLVDVRHGQGVFVRDTSESQGSLFFAAWGKDHSYSIAELLAFRLMLEPELATLAAVRADEAFIERLEIIMSAMEEAAESGDLPGLVQYDTAFHDAISVQAGNRLYSDLLDHVTHLLVDSRRISLAVPGRATLVIARHRVVLEAIRDRAAGKAAEAMRNHLEMFSKDMGVALTPGSSPAAAGEGRHAK